MATVPSSSSSMTSSPSTEMYSRKYLLNAAQWQIVHHAGGPLLVVAGPGSGKTRSLLLLTLELLISGKAQPSEIVLCTFTERAASEMRDRITAHASELGYHGDLAGLRCGTIHSICRQLIEENIASSSFLPDIHTLDETEQRLFILERVLPHLPRNERFLLENRWVSHWELAGVLADYFNHIADDLLADHLREVAQIDAGWRAYEQHNKQMQRAILSAYKYYQNLLLQKNCLDFAHLQVCAYDLLDHKVAGKQILSSVRYVLVDEYQDTNYIQERFLLKLASGAAENNLYVVGDEDQALYRFRGATVRNILEFDQRVPDPKVVRLLSNYRSHRTIIEACNHWMAGCDWRGSDGRLFRSADKDIQGAYSYYPPYQAVYTACYPDKNDEAEQFARLVKMLKEQKKVDDYSQVALLLRSVKPDYSDRYVRALDWAGIPYFRPRAGVYLQQAVVRQMIGCLARVLDAQDLTDMDSEDVPDADLPGYLRDCEKEVRNLCQRFGSLNNTLLAIQNEIVQSEQHPQWVGYTLEHYFYRLVAQLPFAGFLRPQDDWKMAQKNAHRDLTQFSLLLSQFQRYFPHEGIAYETRSKIKKEFFCTFLSVLLVDNFNASEEQEEKIPAGRVPILTVHQAKGLEFPVVVLGGLDSAVLHSGHSNNKYSYLRDCELQTSYEPEQRISEFDYYRLFYVAMSRAQQLLLLTATERWQPPFEPLCATLPVWHGDVLKTLPPAPKLDRKEKLPVRYGLTSHIQSYQSCPRRYEFFYEYRFTKGRGPEFNLGRLVHAMLEYIHYVVKSQGLGALSLESLHATFDKRRKILQQSALEPFDDTQAELAWQQVRAYYEQNQEELDHVIEAELPVEWSQANQAKGPLTGRIDLLVQTEQGPALIDFKTEPRLAPDSPTLIRYRQQLLFYAAALATRPDLQPTRLFLYWTAELEKQEALMEIPYTQEDIARCKEELSSVVERIERKDFRVRQPPKATLCRNCELRTLCKQEMLI